MMLIFITAFKPLAALDLAITGHMNIIKQHLKPIENRINEGHGHLEVTVITRFKKFINFGGFAYKRAGALT
jgi:hypothetical protein